MDLEAELIRKADWGELRRLYSGRLGNSWELAWVQLLRFRDTQGAIQEFKKSQRDPHFEQASYIMLWKLDQLPSRKIVLESQSLRLFLAYEQAELRPLAFWLSADPERKPYAFSLVSRILETKASITADDLEFFQKSTEAGPELTFALGRLWEKKLKDLGRAESLYLNFFSDPLVKKILTESRRILFDPEMSERIRFAYSQRDGLLLRRLQKALLAKLAKNRANIPAPYFLAFSKAMELDMEHLTENLLGSSFWKVSEWSPLACYEILRAVFGSEESVLPPFVLEWRLFFNSKDIQSPPMHLDGDCLPLWQIHVELHPEVISEALLRYPTEERFLFLWSVRNASRSAADKRRWPGDERESETVRKNLERAFDRSTNKVLWFDRLRSGGCSQSFYEHALTKIQIPMTWVLEDLKKNFIQNTPAVRIYLRENLRIVAPSDTGAHLLSHQEFLVALKWLTPAEKQEVLISRFVLSPLPTEILSDEVLDLLWDAKNSVSTDIFSAWRTVVLSYLKSFSLAGLSPRAWLWIESAWAEDAQSLQMFSPNYGGTPLNFPWGTYLQAAFQHGAVNLIIASLATLPDERLKLSWIEALLEAGETKSLKPALHSLKDAAAQSRLMARLWIALKEPLRAALEAKTWMESSAILNDQADAARFYIECYESFEASEKAAQVEALIEVIQTLKSLGVTDIDLQLRVVKLLLEAGQWELAWQNFIGVWWLADEARKLKYFDSLVDLSVQSRKIEDAQRILVQLLFMKSGTDPLQKRVLNSLLDSESPLRLGHVRQEFVLRTSRIDPLHPEILKRRASFDYRASLLWDCFYGTELSSAVKSQSPSQKRRYELWGLTEVMMRSASLRSFVKYLDFYDQSETAGEAHEFFESAKRLLGRLAKHYGVKEKIKIVIRSQALPIRFCFAKARIELTKEFFADLDENMWAAICVGYFQMLQDREKGLYDEVALMERFFQGSLLSGAPISSIVRLLVWLSIAEGLVKPQVMQFKPQELVENLPLLNHLLIFYLGEDFHRKAEECGIQLQ